MDYYKRALELKDETIKNRRHLHEHAEIGLDLPQTVSYIMEQLKSYGIEPKECGHGVTACIGAGEPVLLLRSDMDALPITEQSGEPFSCKTGAMHACGHDFHASMLLTAAKMLKENESTLKGTVKFMFQPAEETFQGAKDMIAHGILENPTPDAALSYHVAIGKQPAGIYMYNSTGTMMHSVDGFKITVTGRGTHGAYPQFGIDPINIGVHIYLALQELIARECSSSNSCVLTIGQFEAGNAANIIPNTAVLQGTLRTDDPDARAYLVKRIHEVAEKTADVYNGTVEIEVLSDVPPLICDSTLTEEMAGYMNELPIPNFKGIPNLSATASEDFATIAEKIPSAYMNLSAGFEDERGEYPIHHPKARFNEDVCPIGAACFAQCAEKWLAHHHK